MGVIESPKFGGIRSERGPAGYYVCVSEKQKDENGNELPFTSQRTERVTL